MEENNPLNYPTGCTSYENFFSNDEMLRFEENVNKTE